MYTEIIRILKRKVRKNSQINQQNFLRRQFIKRSNKQQYILIGN